MPLTLVSRGWGVCFRIFHRTLRKLRGFLKDNKLGETGCLHGVLGDFSRCFRKLASLKKFQLEIKSKNIEVNRLDKL